MNDFAINYFDKYCTVIEMAEIVEIDIHDNLIFFIDIESTKSIANNN